MQKSIFIGVLAVLGSVLTGCGKESVKMEDGTLEAYFSLQPGKTIIYQLDSLVKVPLNDTAYETHSYQAKDVIDTLITDNLNRPSWRVFRYLRPVDSQNESDWLPSDTYLITPTRSSVEVIENNLRFQKLVYPIKLNTAWYGNTYINTTPGGPLDYLDAWQYQYTDVDGSFAPFDNPVPNTLTVLQADMGAGFADDYTPADIDSDGYRTYSVEVYAKNIGLIYKKQIYWTFTARSPLQENGQRKPYPYGYKQGAGVTLRMISHN